MIREMTVTPSPLGELQGVGDSAGPEIGWPLFMAWDFDWEGANCHHERFPVGRRKCYGCGAHVEIVEAKECTR